ncbi:MAG: hypothetical protein QOI80_3161, partial [Solirubrobacteraceae bacterium]|nr:hypothetical protein [Solirubrobacteraceae bacterium]
GAAFVGAFGVGLAPEPAPGVRGADLDEGEALRDEWCVIVVGPQSAIALIARDLGDTGPDMERRFEFALTDDREVVMPAARALLLRVAAQPPPRAEIRADLATPEPAAPGPPGRRRDARPSRASGSARA